MGGTFEASPAHGIIEIMFKRYTSIIGIVFTVAILGIVHTYSPVARSISPHSSHTQHTADASCQVACQATVDRQKNKPSNMQKDDTAPEPTFAFNNAIPIEIMGVGLLQDSALWRQSSWVPPDITLLSSYYSSGL